MKTSTVMSAFLGLVVSASFVFASIEFRRMAGSLNSLGDRVERLEGGSTSRSEPGATADANKQAPSSSPDVALEIARLREEIAALRTGSASHLPGAAGAPGDPLVAAKGGPGLSKDDLSKAVQDAMVQKDKIDKEKQARAYRKQLEVSAKSWAESLAKKLELTETQKNQLATIFADQWGRMNTMWTDTQENENAEAVDYNKLQAETNEKVKLVLTPEQGAKYDEMMKKGNMWGGSVESVDESDSSQK
ncbi:MAG: hypothetical protein AAB074_00570 [Planctomycetota bacterium]